ncbi:hypothetical protein BBJ28_00010766 [Nothophytophthora sp. Chile5]|nr:hypothetical protein BBJ28_00010766 [Nothophytophthora sp. Chile5]
MTKLQRAVVNLVSDTVTRPSAAMRQVIAAAEVGDDVYSADPSVNRLQQVAAERLDKQAALYVPSYTDGTLQISDMANAIRSDDPHYPISKLVALENTQNTCGGRVLSVSYVREVEQFCQQHDLRLHVDGARLSNASVALGVPMAELVAGADSVSLCLSKGLGAPVGSILAGSEEFIYKAKRLRKSLGGGMRQAGVIAAAGLFALENQFDRLAEDHTNAKELAHGLANIPGIEIRPEDVETNILFFKLAPDAKLDAPTLVEKLESEKGILFGGYWNGGRIRAVTNLHVSPKDVEYTVASIRELLA